ncbi:sulfatase [Spirosoma flavus]
MKAFVRWILLGITSLIGLGVQHFPLVPFDSTANRYNVLFIVIDDLRTDLGCYGDSLAHTPTIDQLAQSGLVFDRAYCQQAVCAPSRASMLTGLRSDSLRVWDLNTPVRTHLPNVVTLPQYFKQQGYVTQCIGKIFHDPADHQDAQSWSVPEQLHVTDEAGGKYVLPENMRNGGKGFWKAAPTERADVPDSAYVDGRVAQAAIRALDTLKMQSFFLAVGFRRPHLPFSAPERYWKIHRPEQFASRSNEQLPTGAPAYAGHESPELRGYTDVPPKGKLSDAMKQQLRHGYYASTSYVDAQVGLVLQKLNQLGLAENTVVVLVSDHGFHLGEQGLWTKTSNYELDVRVPLIVSVPAQKANGKHTKALVELIDLFPTLTDLCQLPAPKQMQGKSFKKLLNKSNQPHRSVAISQFPRPWTYKTAPDLIGYSLRNNRYRYTEWRRYQDGSVASSELYDLYHEPLERTNLSDQPASSSILKEMARALRSEIPAKAAPLR